MPGKSLLYEIEGLREHVEERPGRIEKTPRDLLKAILEHEWLTGYAGRKFAGKNRILRDRHLGRIRTLLRPHLLELMTFHGNFKLFVLAAHAKRDYVVSGLLSGRKFRN